MTTVATTMTITTTPIRTTNAKTTTVMTTTLSTVNPITTTTSNPWLCQNIGQVLPYPGDCHKYYICIDEDENGNFTVEVFDCGDWAFDPNQSSCVWPDLSNGLCSNSDYVL